jgi:hypothetical protein
VKFSACLKVWCLLHALSPLHYGEKHEDQRRFDSVTVAPPSSAATSSLEQPEANDRAHDVHTKFRNPHRSKHARGLRSESYPHNIILDTTSCALAASDFAKCLNSKLQGIL